MVVFVLASKRDKNAHEKEVPKLLNVGNESAFESIF